MFLFSIHTIGCKLNQLESEAVADAFRREGFPVVPWEGPERQRPGPLPNPAASAVSAALDPAVSASAALDLAGEPRLLVVNTCTVTSMAEQKARRLIRGALREGAWVLVTGCYAQLNGAELEALGGNSGRLFVVPGDKKSALLDLPRFLSSRLNDSPEFFRGEDPLVLIRQWLLGTGDDLGGRFRFVPENFSSHSRAFLKIQDGCDRRCTYCRVRIARGESLSLPPQEVLRRLRALEVRGCAEAVLTGVNICRYRSAENPPSMGLGALINYLLGGTERIRLRLSSLEPEDIDGELLESLKSGRIRPHFHLSIQSGSRRVLERMGRNYGPEQAARVVSRLRELKEDPFLACDIITGFPGEEEGDFLETLEFCRRMDFAWIHSFPYSPRPGTAAWAFSGRTPQREASARAAKLLDLARRGRRDYARRWLGKELELVLEAKGPGKRGIGGKGPAEREEAQKGPPSPPEFRELRRPWGGTSENYLKLLVPPEWLPPGLGPGSILRCRVRELAGLQAPGGSFPPGGEFDGLGDPRRCWNIYASP
ncbi:MAG: radical SAM protein [Treponema sp.]|jgi:threonylcarbamoyladenosine tRNA methylthiotransferase MtaB|nr:radical SAM protein [Treponema sp.]